MKTVSVVMCTYNGAKYIRQQLDSIIAQKYPIEEVIIQDDGSNDGTIEIVEEYSARYPYIHLYRNEVNKGFNMNFITAFQRAKTDFVAISDQDDIWFADKIEKQVEAIGDNYAACDIRSQLVPEALDGLFSADRGKCGTDYAGQQVNQRITGTDGRNAITARSQADPPAPLLGIVIPSLDQVFSTILLQKEPGRLPVQGPVQAEEDAVRGVYEGEAEIIGHQA